MLLTESFVQQLDGGWFRTKELAGGPFEIFTFADDHDDVAWMYRLLLRLMESQSMHLSEWPGLFWQHNLTSMCVGKHDVNKNKA